MGISRGRTGLLHVLQGRPGHQSQREPHSATHLRTRTLIALLCPQIVDVVNKTLAFHTSVNYEILAPEPFSADVHENLLADLARISQQSYPSDFDLHIDMSRTLKRLNDGHCVYINDCYDCELRLSITLHTTRDC